MKGSIVCKREEPEVHDICKSMCRVDIVIDIVLEDLPASFIHRTLSQKLRWSKYAGGTAIYGNSRSGNSPMAPKPDESVQTILL